MLNVNKIRKDFPTLRQKVHGKPLVYLDSTATAHKPQVVIDAINEFYIEYNSNVHRSVHALAERATLAYEEARKKIARFIGAHPREIIFTRNASEAINLVSNAWGRQNITARDSVLYTVMEHHSNLVPWQMIAKEKGAKVEAVAITDDGYLDEDSLEAELAKHPRVFAFSAASNVLGTINDVSKLSKLAKEAGALAVVDGAQSVPHLPTDVKKLGCDFLAFSGHKMLGPTGIGVLWGRRELLESMPPFLGGGEMIKEVHLKETTFNDPPWRFEAGTPHIEGAIGLGAAVDYLSGIGMNSIRQHEEKLIEHALNVLPKVKHLKLFGPNKMKDRVDAFSFVLADIHPHDISSIVDREGVAIRSGHHCAQPLHERFGIDATARASFYLYNTTEEIDALCVALEKAKTVFKVK